MTGALFTVVGETAVTIAPPPARRTYTKVCKRPECGQPYESYQNTRKPATCTRIECLRAEADEHNAAVAKWHADRAAERAARPKQPRRRRQPQPLYGDMAFVAAINGLDRYGRKVTR